LSRRLTYRWAGMVLSSTSRLPELTQTAENHPTLHVRWTRAPSDLRNCQYFHRWTLPDRSVWLRMARTSDGYLFRFSRFADFHWSRATGVLTGHVHRGAQMKTARHLLLDQVLPVLASGGAATGLHASAVLIDGGAVAFAGKTGSGKSTLGGSFATNGHALITDDCLLWQPGPNGTYAVPTYPSLRLWADAANALAEPLGRRSRVAEYSQKLRISAGPSQAIAFCADPVPLRCVYILDRLTARRPVEIEPLPLRDAFISLVRFGFRLDPFDSPQLLRELDRVVDLARRVPVRRLGIPWQLHALQSVRQAVLADVQSPLSCELEDLTA
jgi:hypothetical protein